MRELIARRYADFARFEAQRRSPLYARIAQAISRDRFVLSFLAALPEAKRQPNLLLGAVCYLYGTPGDADEFFELVRAHPKAIAAVMGARSTQTNEPARCATLLPVLAALPQPLALLEVGAAAGLCLLPDHYAYDYGRVQISPSTPGPTRAPVFSCRASAATPMPERNVQMAWRAGLDLHPVDLSDDLEVRWLEALIWRGEEYRLPLLREACDLARADPPPVIAGDLRADLAALAAQAPAEATLVVFHTAVLAYAHDPADRVAFADSVAELDAVWIANEGPQNIPSVPADIMRERAAGDDFLLCVDGQPAAWTDGHGTWIDWRAT